MSSTLLSRVWSEQDTRAELVEVLTGHVRQHHRFLLGQHLRTIEQLKDSVAAFDAPH